MKKLMIWIVTPMLASIALARPDGPIAEGYDLVELRESRSTVSGKESIYSEHDGRVYRFKSAENKRAFDANPKEFAPAFDSHCAYSLCNSALKDGNFSSAEIVNGQVLFFGDDKAREEFMKDPKKNYQRASKNWEKEKKGL